VPWQDEDLSAAIASGSPEAEEELCRRFQPRIRRKVEASLCSRPDSEDLTTEILQAVLLNLRKGAFHGDCLLSTYVYAITKNKVAEFLRRRRPETSELTDDLPDPSLPTEELLVQREVAQAVGSALESLKPKYRIVLYLYYFKGLSISQIADRLAVPPRRISEWKDYALRVMRGRFGGELGRFR